MAQGLGNPEIMGAPNALRGGPNKKNVSAVELINTGLCSARASDYHYPALRLAALQLAATQGLAAAWRSVSVGPANLLGLADREDLSFGKRADLVILEADNWQLAGTVVLVVRLS